MRATSISHSLLDNPELNLGVVARNAGTSVAMIDTFYAKRLTAEMHKDVLSKRRNGERPSTMTGDARRLMQALQVELRLKGKGTNRKAVKLTNDLAVSGTMRRQAAGQD